MQKRKIRMGMVGGGQGAFIGGVHRIAAAIDQQIELVCGAFSSDPERSKASGKDLYLEDSRCYTDFMTMMAQEAKLAEGERMDFVAIVTPNHVHFPAAKAALEAGFHVLSDKPATFDKAEAIELEQLVEATGLKYGLTHNYTGYPMIKQAREMVQSDEFGKIRKVVVEYPQGWLATPLEKEDQKQAAWRTDPERSGAAGCMGDIGTHAENLAEYLTGLKIKELAADLSAFVDDRLLDDDGNVLLRFEGGAKGVLHASQISVGEENSLNIRIYGEKGGVEWHQMEPNSVIFRTLDAPYCVYRAGSGQPGLYPEASDRCRTPSGHPEGYLEAFANLYRYFAIAVREGQTGKAEGVPGLKSGLRGMAFIEAMVASGASDVKWHPIPDTE